MAGLAQWASDIGHLNGLSSEENYTLAQLTGITNLSGVILCGIIVAGLGVLNDVTITQASAVWEVRPMRRSWVSESCSSAGCAWAGTTWPRRCTRSPSPTPVWPCLR